jgi:hypothetical protein
LKGSGTEVKDDFINVYFSPSSSDTFCVLYKTAMEFNTLTAAFHVDDNMGNMDDEYGETGEQED